MVLLGIWQRALVVTERCFEVPGLRPGEHYCAVEIDELPEAIEWFLDTADGRREAEEMRARAYDTLAETYDFSRVMDGFIGNMLQRGI